MTPLLDRLREAHPTLIKVDVAESLELARDFGIAGTPSFVLVENGAIRRVKLGGQSERGLLKLLTGDAQ
jgi:protein-disulfide isomerase-like protein with CxxC motif